MSKNALRPRGIMITVYAFYLVAGVAFLLFSGAALSQVPNFNFRLWNTLLILGSTLGITGASINRPRVELIGIPGVVACLAVYVIFLTNEATSATRPGVVVGFAAICAAAAVSKLGRAYEIWRPLHARRKVEDQMRDEGS